MICLELLERGLKQLQQENGELIREKSALVSRIHSLERAMARLVSEREPPHVIGLTESEVLQGRQPPRTCEPEAPGEGAGYHHGSAADSRD